MLTKTDSFRQEFEIATQHLATLRQQLDLLPHQQGAPPPALEGLTAALFALKQAHDDLAQRSEQCATCCQDLEKDRAYYCDVFEHAPPARLLTNLSGAIQEANVPASTLLHASRDSLIGRQLVAFMPESERDAFRLHLAQMQEGGVLQGWEAHLQPASGDPVPISFDAVPVHDPERRLVGFQWLLRDISRQAQADEALRQSEHLLRSFVEQSLDGIALTDEQGQVIEWNRAMEQITGLPAPETIGRPIWDLQLQLDAASGPAADPGEQVKSRFLDLLSSGQAPWMGKLLERTYDHPDGTCRVVQGAVFPVQTRNGFMLGSISRDVTDLKRAEEALRQSESKYRRLLDSLHEGVWLIDKDGNTSFVNPRMADMLGYTVDEMVGAHLFSFIDEQDLELVRGRIRRHQQGIGENVGFEFRRKDGTPLYANIEVKPLFDADGQYAGALAAVADMTEHKRAELERERLLAQTQRQADELGTILTAIPDPVAVWDAHGTVLRANPAALAMGIGTDRTGMAGVAERLRVCDADGRHIPVEELPVTRALHGEVIRNETEILVNPAGEEQEILVSVAPVFSKGEIVACVVVSHDITDKRRAERERERLLAENRSQREFLERLVEAAPVGIAVLRGPDHRYELVNPYYQRITGVPDAPMVGRTIAEVIPDLVNRRMPQLMDEVYRTGQTVSTREVKLSFGPEREETYWNTDRVPLHGPEGSVEGILVLAREVTEEVKSRGRIEALSVQAQRQADELAAIFTALVEPVMVSDTQGRILKANPAAVEALGIDPTNLPETELVRRMNVTTPDGRPIPPADLAAARALTGERVRDDYQLLVTASGERAIVVSAAPIVTIGQISGAVVAWHDITELRRAEAARRESEELLRMVVENSRDGINMLDLEAGRYVFMSPAQMALTGFSAEELRELPAEEAYERVHPDDREISISQQRQIAAGRDEGMTVEYRWKVKSGEYRWFSDSRKAVRDEKGRAIALVGVNRDITESKQAEQALRESQRREQKRAAEFEAVLEAVPAAVWIAHDPECLHITGNRAADELLRIARGAESSLTAPIATRPRNFRMIKDGRELTAEELPVQQAARGIAARNSEFTLIFDDGEMRHMLGNAAPLWDEEGRSRGSVAAFVDITDRKQIEETLRASEEKYRLLFQNMAEGFALYELLYDERGEPADWRVLEVNDAYVHHTGVARDRIVGRRISELFPAAPPEYLPRFAAVVATQTPTAFETYVKPVDRHQQVITFPAGGHRFASTIEDITERKLAEKGLADAETKLDRMLQTMMDGMVVVDLTGQITYANRGAERILGTRRDELSGKYFNSREWQQLDEHGQPFPPDQLPLAVAMREQRDVGPVEHRIADSDGTTKWISVNAAPLFDEGGHLYGAVASFRDISAHMQAESALRESEQKLSALFELMPVGVYILNQDLRITNQNAALARILGVSRDALFLSNHQARTYLRSDGTFMPPDEFPSARALREQRLVHDLVGIVNEDETVTWIDVSAAPVPFPDWRVVVATVDVTERKQFEQFLREARDELELRVFERTAELESANQMLLAEIRERTRAESELRLSEQRLEQRVNERTQELATLLDISNTVALTIDLEPLLALILERLKDVVDYDGGAAFRLDGGTLIPVFHRGVIPPDELLHIGSHLEEAFLGHAVIQGPEPMILADVQGQPVLQEAFRQAVGARLGYMAGVVRAWMAVPVTIKQRVYGVLYLYHSRPGRYAEDQARLALPFGNQAAVAIENARLYEQAQTLAALEERQHLARELHDAVTQTLFSASLAAEVLPRLWDRDREAGLHCLSEVQQLTRGALAEMRTLLLELRPAALVETELSALLRQLAEAHANRVRIPVTVETAPSCPLPAKVQVAMYRITQEALNNSAKHAEARHVVVALKCVPPGEIGNAGPYAIDVELSVADDGRGFDPDNGQPGNKGLGLGIMRERAQAVGAVFHLDSRSGQGTRIAVFWEGEKHE